MSEQDNKEMPLMGHLQEFRIRLIISLVVVAITSSVAYNWVEEIIAMISAPAGKLYFMNPAEVFFSYLEIAVFTGVVVSLPVIVWELWCFVAPAFTRHEKRLALALVPACVVLFYTGLIFSYFFVLPAAVRFFMGFATETLQPMFSLEAYLSFFISFVLPFGFAFELPLVLFLLMRVGIVSPAFLRRKRKIFIVLAFIFAAVISPTADIFTQTMIAVPMIVLYQASLILMRFVKPKEEQTGA